MKGMRVMLGAIVGRLCQTPRGQVGVSQKRPTNPMRGIISGVVLNTLSTRSTWPRFRLHSEVRQDKG